LNKNDVKKRSQQQQLKNDYELNKCFSCLFVTSLCSNNKYKNIFVVYERLVFLYILCKYDFGIKGEEEDAQGISISNNSDLVKNWNWDEISIKCI